MSKWTFMVLDWFTKLWKCTLLSETLTGVTCTIKNDFLFPFKVGNVCRKQQSDACKLHCIHLRVVSVLCEVSARVVTSELIMSYSSNWITLLLLCTSTPLVSCCDRFDHGSRQVTRDPVELVPVDYDITLHCQIARFLQIYRDKNDDRLW